MLTFIFGTLYTFVLVLDGVWCVHLQPVVVYTCVIRFLSRNVICLDRPPLSGLARHTHIGVIQVRGTLCNDISTSSNVNVQKYTTYCTCISLKNNRFCYY